MAKEFSVERDSYVVDNEKRLWIHESVDIDQVSVESSSLYIFTKATDYVNKGIIKIGETGSKTGHRSVRSRLYEQTNSTDTEPLLLLYMLDCKEYIETGTISSARELEQYLHESYKDVKWSAGAGNEWYGVDVSDVIKRIRLKLGDDKIAKKKFEPHLLQEIVLLKCQDIVENGGSDINLIAELCARFGKTLMYLELFNRLDDRDIMIIPSYVHTVFTSFEKEIVGDFRDENLGKFTNFEGFKIIDTTSENGWQEKLTSNVGKCKLVVFVSVQIEDISRLDMIKSIDSSRKFVLIDEADFGAHTEKSKKIIEYIA